MSRPLTHRTVLAIAVPIVLSNATVPLVGAVDTAVVGQLGDAALIGGVGVGGLVLSYAVWLLAFLRADTAGMTARASGADQNDEVRATLGRSIAIGLGLGAALVLLAPQIWTFAAWLVPASEAVETHARTYVITRLYGAPAMLANFALLGWFMGRKRTSRVLMLQLFLNGTNIVLDLYFVLDLGWGVRGVAAASAAAEWATLFPALLLARRDLRELGGAWDLDRLLDWPRIRQTLASNRDLMLRTSFLVTAFAMTQAQSAAFGDTVIAASTILMNLLTIAAYGLDGFAIAAEALTGDAIGARNRARFDRAVRLTSVWAAFSALGFSLLWFGAGPSIIALMSTSDAVRETTLVYLPWVVIQPVLAATCFQLDGIYIGMGATRAMRNWMALSFAIFVGAFLLAVPAWQAHGVWAAFNLFFIARAITQLIGLKRATALSFA